MPPHARGPNDRDGGDPRSRTVGIDHLTLLQVSPPELVTIASETGFDAIGIRVATAGPGEEPWPPFYALEVVPSITFTYGGLRSDLEGRVLDHDNVPVSGLWVGGCRTGRMQAAWQQPTSPVGVQEWRRRGRAWRHRAARSRHLFRITIRTRYPLADALFEWSFFPKMQQPWTG